MPKKNSKTSTALLAAGAALHFGGMILGRRVMRVRHLISMGVGALAMGAGALGIPHTKKKPAAKKKTSSKRRRPAAKKRTAARLQKNAPPAVAPRRITEKPPPANVFAFGAIQIASGDADKCRH